MNLTQGRNAERFCEALVICNRSHRTFTSYEIEFLSKLTREYETNGVYSSVSVKQWNMLMELKRGAA